MILVVLYDVAHGHFGGLVAAPVFSAIAATAIQRLDVTPVKRSPTYDTASLLPFLGGTENDNDEATIGGDASDTASSEKTVRAESDSTSSRREAVAFGTVPDFGGASLRSALGIARAHGLTVEIRGDGYVVKQFPAAGSALEGGRVKPILSDETGADGQPFVPPVREARGSSRGRG